MGMLLPSSSYHEDSTNMVRDHCMTLPFMPDWQIIPAVWTPRAGFLQCSTMACCSTLPRHRHPLFGLHTSSRMICRWKHLSYFKEEVTTWHIGLAIGVHTAGLPHHNPSCFRELIPRGCSTRGRCLHHPKCCDVDTFFWWLQQKHAYKLFRMSHSVAARISSRPVPYRYLQHRWVFEQFVMRALISISLLSLGSCNKLLSPATRQVC